jgi:hypothetical protein
MPRQGDFAEGDGTGRRVGKTEKAADEYVRCRDMRVRAGEKRANPARHATAADAQARIDRVRVRGTSDPRCQRRDQVQGQKDQGRRGGEDAESRNKKEAPAS